MISEAHSNITINTNIKSEKNGNQIVVIPTEKFKTTVIIDNVTQHHYKCYKITIDEMEGNEKLITVYAEVTKITCNIVVPPDKKALIIINDAFW